MNVKYAKRAFHEPGADCYAAAVYQRTANGQLRKVWDSDTEW